MSLLRFTKIVIFITIMALVYINMQMQIIELAYRGKAKEQQVRKLIEVNSHLTTKILTLKSSNNLGDKLLVDHKQMEFLAPQSIVEVPVKNYKKANVSKADISLKPAKQTRSVLSLLSLGAEAQAGMDR